MSRARWVLAGPFVAAWRRRGPSRCRSDVGHELRAHGVARGGLASAVPAVPHDCDTARQKAASSASFVQMAAHELGKPMTPVLFAARMLRTSLHDPEAARRHLDSLERGVERMRRLLDDLLVAARLQDHRMPVARDAIDLRTVAGELVDGYQGVAVEKGLRLSLEAAADPVLVYADPGHVAQVVANLLDNAIRYTPRGGRVEVRVRSGPIGGTIEVSDTGIGLTSAQQERLFRPFARVHDSLVGAPPGTGLGLYLAKGIVERQGGRLECRSAGRGRGSTFAVHLSDVLVIEDTDDASGVAIAPGRSGRPASGA